MRLPQELLTQLVSPYAAESLPLTDIINDACELLTMQVVLLLKKRAAMMQEQMQSLPTVSVTRQRLAAEVNGLRKFMVELSETHP